MNLQNKVSISDGSGRGHAEISSCTVSLQETLSGYRMRFSFSIDAFKSYTDDASACPTLEKLVVDLSLREAGSVLLIGRMLDDLNDEPKRLRGRNIQVTKFIEIRQDDFVRLVDKTHLGDVVFELSVRPILTGAGHDTYVGKGTLVAPHSEWLRIINSVNVERFELITIRTPPVSSHLHTPYLEACKKIRDAEQQFLRGDWNGVGSSCRAAWRTVLSSAPTGAKPFDHLLAKVTGDPTRKKFAEALLKGLHDIQNVAVHLEGDVKTGVPPADLTREDAMLCIHWYSAVIGYLSMN